MATSKNLERVCAIVLIVSLLAELSIESSMIPPLKIVPK